MMVLSFADDRQQAEELADALTGDVTVCTGTIDVHRFPDGESLVRLPAMLQINPPACVMLLCSLNQPNSKLVELLLAASVARDNGVQQLILVAPYLCYMRQDKAFHTGEAVSQRVIGSLLAGAFDAVVTVDPHLHRVQHIEQAIPATRAVALTASCLMGDYIARQVDNPLLLGPDEESLQWVAAVASGHGFDTGVATKERLGDRDVVIHMPTDINVSGRNIVLVDDIASTGRTLLTAAVAARSAGAASVSAIITHALFAEDAWQRLKTSDFNHIWSTDSIAHASNVISLGPLLADGVRQCL